MYEVIFYKDRLGNEPIKEYLYALKKKGLKSKNDRILAEKILAYIKALQDYGTRVGAPIVKHIDGDIWELRPLNNRILFFYWKNDTFVLLHHFVKKTNKTPRREIDQARRNLQDFLERSQLT
ncbi:MAG: type II toxin-antitoxin system RelE/ParE family toxin [Clostridia bacterium]|nr:type II toxin-antitoxin system RelE/ParE family toxin [Clostridia bacterium]